MIDNLLNVPLELKVVPVFPTPVSIVTLDDKSLNDLLIYDIDKERERKSKARDSERRDMEAGRVE